MKLIEEILSKTNLNLAYKKVVSNKGAEGIDGVSVSELKEYIKENWENIKGDILTQTYKPSPVKQIEIPKDNGKVRKLGIPTVMDRLIQQAVVQVLSPIFEETFSDSSYGFRPNRSAQQAVIKTLEMINDGNEWIIEIDLEKFFDTINHDKLISIVRKTMNEKEVLYLIRAYHTSGAVFDGNKIKTEVGSAQGGAIVIPQFQYVKRVRLTAQ